MLRSFIISALVVGCTLTASAQRLNVRPNQPKLVEKVNAQPGKLIIPYEKYVLPNGLTVILHEDHSDPMVHVDVTYHVGSAREEVGKSGFAHFFEHMMFQGSENVADEEHFKIVSESGGTLNGTTNRDRTNYFETMPSNQLETALWLEADRMGFLLDAVTQQKFEVQRSTVKNERGQNYDNRPYGLVWETTSQNLYPYGHPYSWLTIGYVEDLDRVDVEDLKRFFLRWYGPNNATLTVGGDISPNQVLDWVEKYFGSIPMGPTVEKKTAMLPRLEVDRYVTLEDKIRMPQLNMVFSAPEMYHKDVPALEVLAKILGGSDYSILEEDFVKTQKAIFARSYLNSSELAGEFTFTVRAFPGTKLADMEKMLRKSIARIGEKGITDQELAIAKASFETDFVNSMSSVWSKVSSLASYQTYLGNPNYLQKELDQYLAVTKEDVMRVYKQYIQHKYAVILSVIPEGEFSLEARSSNHSINHFDYKPPKDEYDGLSYRHPKDNFDRSERPSSGPNPSMKLPALWQETLGNGIPVLGTETDEVPKTLVQITVRDLRLLESKDLKKAGVTSLLAKMMEESTQKHSSEEFSRALDLLGGSIWVSVDGEDLKIYVSGLSKNMAGILDLCRERLFEPGFKEDDWERVKKSHLEGIKEATLRPSTISSQAFQKHLYSPDDIRGIPVGGTYESVSDIELSDVIDFYQQNFASNKVNVTVVGDMPKEEVVSKLKFLESWQKKSVADPVLPAMPSAGNTKLFLVDKQGAPQSEIRMGYPAMAWDAYGDYYKAKLMDYPLGGAFNSRINLNLREDKGYTYGARSWFGATEHGGSFIASASVRGDATDSSVVEFVKELKLYQEKGITPEELDFMKQSIGQSEARNYESDWQKASFLSQISEYGLSPDFVDKQNQILKDITADEINALAKKYIKPDEMMLFVVGDKEKILPGLQKLGYEIVELDLNGDVVKQGGSEGGR